VERESELVGEFFDFVANVARVQTEMLFFLFGWTRSFDFDVLKSCSRKFYVMAIRAIGCDSKWNSFGIR